jgi:hypothetical protein
MFFMASLVFRTEGVGVTFDVSSSGAGVAPEVNGPVPAKQVRKQKVHRPNKSPMSSKLVNFIPFRAGDVGVTCDALSLEAGVAPEVNVSVPANVTEQVSKKTAKHNI